MEIKPIEGVKDNTLAPNQHIIFLACMFAPHNIQIQLQNINNKKFQVESHNKEFKGGYNHYWLNTISLQCLERLR